MGYLSNIRHSFTSLLTPGKNRSPLQRQRPPTPPASTSTAPAIQSLEKALQRRSMSPTSKTQDWLSSRHSSHGVGEGGTSGELLRAKVKGGYTPMRGAMETPENYNFMLPTPVTSGLKRKLGFGRDDVSRERVMGDTGYGGDEDLEGSTVVVDDETPAKRRRVAGDFEYTIAPGTGHDDEELLEGDTLLDGVEELPAGSESEYQPTDVDDAEDQAEYRAMRMPNFRREPSNFSDDQHISESGDEMVLVPPNRHTGSRHSRASSFAQDVYRPSPKIVDKNLTGNIVVRADEDSELSEEEMVGKEYAVKKNDRKEVAYDFSMEKAKRWADAVKLPDGHWAEAEQDLFFRLAMRGFEPLVPSSWQLDFNTLPESLFSHPGEDSEPFIYSVKGQDFRAIKSLGDLFDLGNLVRDRLFLRLRPEPVIYRTINAYIKWALKDSGLLHLANAIPVHAIYSLKKGESTRQAVQTLNHRLVSLGNRYRDAWRLMPSIETSIHENDNHQSEPHIEYASRSFPVLTGFLICGPIVALLTLDSDPEVHPVLDPENSSGKFISQFDFAEFGQDVWNALAIAIAIVGMRKTMGRVDMEGKEEGMWMGGVGGTKVEEDCDPDL
ncbi:hypothetical protein FQN52_002761 [Onygenales sp. PD_12]|nr:hypothetical protein FQN52_002761 [Onygenales sp. PD_12]